MIDPHDAGSPDANGDGTADDPGPSLPPPAFPPGERRRQMRRAGARPGMDDALISPDEPLPERNDAVADAMISPDDPIPSGGPRRVDDAFISPDEPIPHREPRRGGVAAPAETEEVVVTGMGDDAHLDPGELVAAGDPHVMELTRRVAKLAEALKRRGEAGLRTTPEMDRFEATLRAYCVGYLAGRRVEDDDTPDF